MHVYIYIHTVYATIRAHLLFRRRRHRRMLKQNRYREKQCYEDRTRVKYTVPQIMVVFRSAKVFSEQCTQKAVRASLNYRNQTFATTAVNQTRGCTANVVIFDNNRQASLIPQPAYVRRWHAILNACVVRETFVLAISTLL